MFDVARSLNRALRECDESRRMRGLGAKVAKDARLDRLLADFRKAQFEVQAVQLQGQQVKKEQVDRLHKLAAAVEAEALLRDYMAAENAYGAMLLEVQKVLAEAFQPDVPGKVKH
ncbi:MAG TPA: YlbF family regulator [Symbiobacteriaceae bacterium]|nr:YlbF family regulator [Symbiobacteriaceae bacterium]